MNRLLLIVGGLGLLLVNAFFFWLNPAVPLSDSSEVPRDDWKLDRLVTPARVKPEDLIASGVWGELPGGDQSARGEGSQQSVEGSEAQVLRQKLRGIVHQGGEWRVLVEQGADVVDVGIGHLLTGTRWKIASIHPDRLLLQDGEQQRSLLLFPLPDEAQEL